MYRPGFRLSAWAAPDVAACKGGTAREGSPNGNAANRSANNQTYFRFRMLVPPSGIETSEFCAESPISNLSLPQKDTPTVDSRQAQGALNSGSFRCSAKQTASRPRSGRPLQMQRAPPDSVFL